MTGLPGSRERYLPIQKWCGPLLGALALINLAGCSTTSSTLAQPSSDWQVRTGQLLYRNGKNTLVGDVLVRFSKTGDFELSFYKGPGVTVLTIRQNESFAEVKGGLAGKTWAGPVARAPKPLRGWLGLRERIIHAQDRQIRHASGGETFLLRF